MRTVAVALSCEIEGFRPPEVLSHFDLRLFLALRPTVPHLSVIRFDGSKPGDRVMVKIGIPPVYQRWESVITDEKVGEDESYFVDEGAVLPWPIKSWRHRHIIRRTDRGSVIIDDIECGLPDWVPHGLAAWGLRRAFGARAAVYKRYFAGLQR